MRNENSYIKNLKGEVIYGGLYTKETKSKINELEKKIIKIDDKATKEDKEKTNKLNNDIRKDIKTQIKKVESNIATYKREQFNQDKLYSATIPYSLETLRVADRIRFITNNSDGFSYRDGIQKTEIFVNVTFDNDYKLLDENNRTIRKVKKKNIRKHLYNNGFNYTTTTKDGADVETKHYVFYKRGAGKAKEGSCIFILEEYLEFFRDRSRLGVKFEHNEKMDLTSVFAYESLIMSGIDFTIELEPKTEILLIDDVYGKKFKSKVSKTYLNDKNELATENDTKFMQQNCFSDGQSLMDESVFNKQYFEKISTGLYKNVDKVKKLNKILIKATGNKKYNVKSPKAMMLLREDWLKSNAINTKLQKWFSKNGITKITDMVGRELDAKKIKLVITPNSLKWLKLAYKFNSKKECYEHWLNKIDGIFGVVKQDKEGNFGTCNRLTYQLLNSLPITEPQLKELLQEELDYIKLLKNDKEVFDNYVATNMTRIELDEALQFTEDGDEVEITTFNSIENTETSDMISCLNAINPNFKNTEKYATWRAKQVETYRENIRKGKIRLKDTKYCTIVANPYEMLQAITGHYKQGESICEGREVYCSYYKEGQEFCISRNPHINIGNVMHGVNKFHKEYEDWFNFSENMIIVNINDNDAPARGEGYDQDSDTLLIIPNITLVEHAKDSYKYYTPVNCVKGVSKPRKNNMNELAKLDDMLANNLIGKIINTSAIYNAYMLRAIYEKKDQKLINLLYQQSSALSSLSQVEIDKSKKVFDNLNLGKELRKIKNATDEKGNLLIEKITDYKYDETKKECIEYQKTIVPKFFSIVAEPTEYRHYINFPIAMDYLQNILDTEIERKGKDDKYAKFKTLLVAESSLPKNLRRNENQIDKIYEIVERYSKDLNKLNIKKSKDGRTTLTELLKTEEKIKSYKRNVKKKAIKDLQEIKVNAKTILQILIRCFDSSKEKDKDKKWSKYSLNTMKILYQAFNKEFLLCFKLEHSSKDMKLVESKKGNIEFWNKKYKKVTVKESCKKKVS